MKNLSIMPLITEHVDEICSDIVEQQRSGVSTQAMMIMHFSPEGTPPINRAEQYCKKFDLFRERLDKAGAKYGVLVQSTLGHINEPSTPHPFQHVVNFVDGVEMKSTCCPLDKGFQAYIKEQMRVLATHNPSSVLIDDDIGILYRKGKGCACPLHMAEFNRRAKTNMTREELYEHTQGNSEENKYYTKLYIDLQADSLLEAVHAMREGLDIVNPEIQGMVSGIYLRNFCEFTDRVVEAFAGKGNPRICRINNGMYTSSDPRCFSANMYRAARLREYLKGKVDVLLAETDTTPYNRYSTSAAMLHAHFAGTILEGATGAKHWITRLSTYEPNSGKAYRKILSEHAGFYEKLVEYTADLKPFGCKIPISLEQDYGFVPSEEEINRSPWSTCVLERLGFPLHFSNDGEGAVFLDNISVKKFNDDQIHEFLKGTVVLSSGAAAILNKRGFSDHIGVEIADWKGKKIYGEIVDGNIIAKQYEFKQLIIREKLVEPLSYAVHRPDVETIEIMFPAVTGFVNPSGGYTVVFSGNPDAPFSYATSFSLLNETRKKQFTTILEKQGNLPIYCSGDAEVYIRAGYLKNGKILCAIFNIGLDVLENISLCCKKDVKKIEKLNKDGLLSECHFLAEDGNISIEEKVEVLKPVVLLIS